MLSTDFDGLAEKVFHGPWGITLNESCSLIGLTKNSDIIYLASLANRIREEFCGTRIHLCSIINAKSGRCSEDCSFCAQSGFYNTESPAYPLLSRDIILK